MDYNYLSSKDDKKVHFHCCTNQ